MRTSHMVREILKTNKLIVFYYPKDRLIIQSWRGSVSADQYRDLNNIVASLFNFYDIKYCISKEKPFLLDVDEFELEFLAKCSLRGLKRLALVDPSIEGARTVKKENSIVETACFNSCTSAEQWIFN